MPGPVIFDPELACDACGKFGAFAFEGERLCLDCYEARGSCCAEANIGKEEPDEAASCEIRRQGAKDKGSNTA